MASVIIHIGTHKTGSTFLQDRMAASRGRHAAAGVVYPDYGSSAHHALIAHWNNLPKGYLTAGDPDRAWQDLARRYSRSQQTIVLSSEEFSRVSANRPDFAKIFRYLADFESVRLICFVRHQISLLQSIYTEVSKISSPPPPPAVVSEAIETGRFSGVAIDCNQLLDVLSAQVPKECLEFHSYDQACATPGGIFAYLERLIGISPAAEDAANDRVNESAPPLAVWASNMISAPAVSSGRLTALVSSAIGRTVPGALKGMIFNPDEIDRLIDHFGPANVRFAKRISESNPHYQSPQHRRSAGVSRRDVNVVAWNEIARALFESSNLAAPH